MMGGRLDPAQPDPTAGASPMPAVEAEDRRSRGGSGFPARAAAVLAGKRLRAQWPLAVATVLGLVAVLAFSISLPMYSDAVYNQVLRDELTGGDVPVEAPDLPMRFTFEYQVAGASRLPLQLQNLSPIDAYLTESAVDRLGLPTVTAARYLRTAPVELFPGDGSLYSNRKTPLAVVSLASFDGLVGHARLLEGSVPTGVDPTNVAQVLVSRTFALETGLHAGEVFLAVAPPDIRLPIRISGVWEPIDPAAEFWFTRPQVFDRQLIVSRETFAQVLPPALRDEVQNAVWHFVLDGSDVHSDDVSGLQFSINDVLQEASSNLPGIRLSSPAGALARYREDANSLTVLLFAISLPVMGMLLGFVILLARLRMLRHRNEIAVLHSRGATRAQLVGVAMLEAIFLSTVALVLAIPAARALTHLIGRTRGFGEFASAGNLEAVFSRAAWVTAGLATVVVIVVQVLPVVTAAGQTIVSYKQERARAARRPLWQRYWLDVAVLLVAAYGSYLLRDQGAVTRTGTRPLSNPLLFLVPALFALGFALITLRLLPRLSSLLSRLLSRTRSVSALLAARHLGRSPGLYTVPLMLLMLTLGLFGFVASLAATLDDHLVDRSSYQVGTDLRFPASSELQVSGDGEERELRWRFLPISEFARLPAVTEASDVGIYGAESALSGAQQTGTFLGVDAVSFPQVAFWRDDFASSDLPELMGALRTVPNGVLLPRSFMAQHALDAGDAFRLSVKTFGERLELDLRVAGAFDLFPSWYPTDGALFVGNLAFIFQNAGGRIPHDVWLRTDPDAPLDDIITDIQEIDVSVRVWDTPRTNIAAEQEEPQRRGVFGALTLGFLTAGVLTVAGFVLYALFSFRRRTIELSTLRALGLTPGRVRRVLLWELAILLVIGLAVGVALGAGVSALYIPYLQVGADPIDRVPPFGVTIEWRMIGVMSALIAVTFAATVGGVVLGLRRTQLFEALKLGETV